MDLKSTYNKIAEDWFNDHDQDTWWQSGTDKFLSFLGKDDSILDIGCGAGQKTRYIHSKGYKVTGLDFSEKMVEIARRQAPDIHFDVADIYEIDKYPKTFDAVFAQAVLLHIPKSEIVDVIKKLLSVLNAKGFLYIAVKALGQRGEEKIETESNYGYEYSRFFSYYTMEELVGYFEELNIELVWNEITHSGKTDWLQIVGRKK